MKTIHKVKIDLLTPGLHTRVYAVQDDICTREVQISLYSGSVSWTPTSGAGVAVGYRKSDGTVGIYDTLPDGSSAVSISGNVVTVILAAQMLTAAGTVEAAVTLAEKSGNQITTFAFDVIVSANPGSGAIKSEDYFNYVNPKIQAVIEQAAAATTAANTAASRANASAELAEDAYDLADTANQKVDTLREVVSKLHNNIVETASGEVITVSDSAEAPLQGLKVYGKTTQNGTPTPEAPVPLESVGESVNVTVCGKNLISLHDTTDRHNDLNTASIAEEVSGAVTMTGTTTGTWSAMRYFWKIRSGTYTFSCKIQNDNCFAYALLRSGPTVTQVSQHVGELRANGSITFTLEENCILEIRLHFTGNEAVTNGTISYYDIQLESGSIATTYEPYKEAQTLTLTTEYGLPGIPVTSGGNYTDNSGQQWLCDEVDFEKGVYVQRIDRHKFDGTVNDWEIAYNNTNNVSAQYKGLTGKIRKVSSNEIKANILCSSYMLDTTGNVYNRKHDNIYSVNVTGHLRFYRSSVMTNTVDISAFAASMAGVEVIYELAEENPLPLSEIDPDALAAFAALHSNYPNTTVFNDAGAGMEVKYVADTKLYIDNKINAMAAAIVNA